MGKILLRGGRVIDGTGSAAFDGSVLIDGDRIEAVLKGKEVSPDSDTVIDATDYAIAPGFIDMHSHMDWSLPLNEHPQLLKCFLEQGVTTLVGGNCGFSPAPVTSETLGLLEKECMLPIDKPLDYNWRSMNEFLEETQQRKPVINLAQLVGHATVRIAVVSTRRGPMKQDELRSCLRKLEQSLDEGACGVSFGLGYDPGIYSPLEEIEAFAAIAAKAKKPMTVHLKTYTRLSAAYPITYYKPHNLRALKEMLDVARRTCIALQISHFMVAFRITWPMVEVSLQTIERALNEGVDVMFDALPYTDLNGSVATLLPMWFLMKLPQGYRSLLMLTGAKIVNAIGFRRVGYSYSKQCLLMDAGVEGWEDMSGLTIDEIARQRRMSPSDVVFKLCESSNGHAAILCKDVAGEPGNDKHLDAILSHDLCLFETDSLVRSKGYPNAAAFGAFPKILGHYVREKRLFSIENAVRRMTSASVARFGLKDRGVLAPGKAADVVIFDSGIVSETPPAANKPVGKPVGIKHVFLNGVHVVKDGSYVSTTRAGKVLRV